MEFSPSPLPSQPSSQLNFTLSSVSQLLSTAVTTSHPSSSSFSASFIADSGNVELRIRPDSRPEPANDTVVRVVDSELFRLSPVESVCISGTLVDNKEEAYAKGNTLKFRNEDESMAFHRAFELRKKEAINKASKSKFDSKIEEMSAKVYFHYYGQLLHQQNMLQDYVRTGTYYAAVMENRADFAGRVVVDVGAGSGILSLFAAQAGAKHVYAVEASEMAEYARKLIEGNPFLTERITVIKGKIKDVEIPDKADILISEPMGTLLVNERMLESYVIARDRFLVPNGKMFPGVGRIHMAPFSDEYLFIEMANKALFWQQKNYFGVDLTSLYEPASQGYFLQHIWRSH